MTSIKELELHRERDAFAHWSNILTQVYFSKKHPHSDLPQKYDHPWQSIVMPFGYGKSCNWELFGMTGIRNDIFNLFFMISIKELELHSHRDVFLHWSNIISRGKSS